MIQLLCLELRTAECLMEVSGIEPESTDCQDRCITFMLHPHIIDVQRFYYFNINPTRLQRSKYQRVRKVSVT